MSIFGNLWRGMDSEDDMTEQDWRARGHDQAMHMREGGDWKDANIDSEGTPTAGCYNGDYSDEYHNECNRRLETDEHFEAKVDAQVRELYHGHQDR